MYLFFSKFSPKTSHGSLIGVSRQQGAGFPGLVKVLDNDEGLCDGLATVNQDGDSLVDGVALDKDRSLFKEVLFQVLVLDPLQVESPFCPLHIWATYGLCRAPSSLTCDICVVL